jgi:signal transduction histidine kinase
MDDEMLEFYTRLNESILKEDWKKALNTFFLTFRKKFIYDNLAIYLIEKGGTMAEAVFARAIGRGRSREADVSWGEEIANQVVNTNRIVVAKPPDLSSTDRIAMPYILGLPLHVPSGSGAIVFIRFGGPDYTDDQLPLAVLAAAQAARIFEQHTLTECQSQLDLARQRAEFQDDFIATISHDLHTPLGFIKGYSTSLLRSDTIWDAATQREFLTIIDEESDQLVNLIDRILDSARLQSGSMPMDFQLVRLDSLLRDVIQRIQGRHKDLEVEQNISAAPPIQADTTRLAQVFTNLFDNAIIYAPGSKITITLHVSKDKQTVTFSDYGPGISSEHLPYLFERFYRVSGQTNKRGTGLGLFICKQIIQAHRGRISVNTAPGKGTAFIVELPA